MLRSCYVRSLAVAGELGARSVAFPLVSAGIFRWPAGSAISIALGALRASNIPDVRLVLFSEDLYERALDLLG